MWLQQTRTQIEADLLISRLRAAGLHPSDLRIWPHVTLAGGDLFYRIEVPADEAEAAKQIIHATDQDGEDLSGRRPGLGAIRVGVVLFIALVAAGMLLP